MVLNLFPSSARAWRPTRTGVRRFLAFTWGSGAGLLTDLSIFIVLNALGVAAFLANVLSTAVAITLVYLLVSRHSFGARATWRTYGAFFAWYGTSALLVSAAISVLGGGDAGRNLVWKIAFVPVTFVTNYFFGRWLFRDRAAVDGRPLLQRRFVRRPRRALGPAARRYLDVVGRHPWRASGVATIVFMVLVFPMTNAMSFAEQDERFQVLREYGTHAAFALTLFCLLRWAIRFSVGVLRDDPHYRRWLTATVVYLVLMIPFFVALYPGHWVFDEYDTVYGATHWFTLAWQGYLTHVYYQFCLFLLPSAVGIVVVQICFIAIVCGYVVTLVAARLQRKWLSYLVIVALLSPAVILNNFYPLRLTAYGYLLLLVVAHLVRRSTERTDRPRLGEFFAVSCGIAILAFWRSEGILTLLLLPVAFVVLGLARAARTRLPSVVTLVAAGLAVIAFSGWITTSANDPKYQLTAMINPLSTMIQGPLQGPNVQQDLRVVDQVVNVEMMRTMPAYLETPVFWSGGLRPDAVKHTGPFIAAYADLVIHNPGPFLDNRWRAFLAANTQDAWAPQVQVGGINGSSPAPTQKFEAFEQSTLFGQAWNLQLKYQTARHLFLLDSTLQPTVWARIVWNAIPEILLLLVVMGYAIVRRRWALAVATGVVVGGALLVFLTEPASYFMYFVPVFVTGLCAGAAILARAVDLALSRRERRTADRSTLLLEGRQPVAAPSAPAAADPVPVA